MERENPCTPTRSMHIAEYIEAGKILQNQLVDAMAFEPIGSLLLGNINSRFPRHANQVGK
jgi:hypothetical protein